MWSGPRNVSTAVMYAFAQRPDTQVVDEPFYAHYLLQSGADHPGRAEVLESQSRDPSIVMREITSEMPNHDVLFLKNMAHHMLNMDEELERLTDEFVHLFLIRDPAEMLLSLDKTLPNPTMRDTAYRRQLQLFKKVQNSSRPFCVIDSRELLENPKYNEQVAAAIAEKFKDRKVEVVASAAIGGILLAYEVARWAANLRKGLIYGLDGTWYRLNRHQAFIPLMNLDQED